MAQDQLDQDQDHQKQIEEFGKNDDFWLFGYGSLIWKPPPHYDLRVPGYIEGYVRRFWQASEDHRGTPEAPGRVVTLIDRAHWETLTDHHEPTERVWGAAYHIPSTHVAEVRNYLDIREINGYSIQFTPFHPAEFVTSISSPPATPSATLSDSPLDTSTTKSNSSAPEHQTTGPTEGNLMPQSQRPSITARTTISASHPYPAPLNCLVYIGLPTNPQFLGPQDPDALARKIVESKGPSGENKEYLYMLERGLKELGTRSGDAHVEDLSRRCRALEGEREDVDDEEEAEQPAAHGEVLHRVGSTEEQEEVER